MASTKSENRRRKSLSERHLCLPPVVGILLSPALKLFSAKLLRLILRCAPNCGVHCNALNAKVRIVDAYAADGDRQAASASLRVSESQTPRNEVARNVDAREERTR